MNFSILVGPVVGAIIGYFTNYLAVKMLFRPLIPIKLGKFILPFTPGVIPKRKGALASSLGQAVGTKLLTTQDIENTLVIGPLKDSIVSGIVHSLITESDSAPSLKDIGKTYVGIPYYETGKSNLESILSYKIKKGIMQLDLGKLIAEEGSHILREKTKGTMLAMFINDDLIASLAEPIGKQILDYLEERGEELIHPIILDEMETLEQESIPKLINRSSISTEHLHQIVENIYTRFVHHHVPSLLKQLDFSEIVEKKVLEMEVLEIEHLVLSVIKTELNTIVNLGALIGFLIGLTTIWL